MKIFPVILKFQWELYHGRLAHCPRGRVGDMTAAHFSAKLFTHHRDPECAYMYTLTASLPHTHAKYVRVALYLSNGTYPYDTSANTSTDQYINAGHPHCDYMQSTK
jgi:hypothetical protein